MYQPFENEPMDEDEGLFSEFCIDDALDELSRLKKYATSDFHLQRKILVKDIYNICLKVGYNVAKKEILPLVANFVSDNESNVRQALAEQLYPLAVFFYENGEEGEGQLQLTQTFIPYTFELIIDKKIDVSETATDALVKIAEMIPQCDVELKLFTVIRNLCRDENVEVYRIAAAKLFNCLSPIFGEELCVVRVVEEIIYLSKDPSLSVRKTVSQNLDVITSIVGVDITVKKLFPCYLDLSRDEIWGVRKACVESLPLISSNVSSTIRCKQLTKLFEEFTDDVSRWVKIEAFKQLGKFIATFKKHEINETLIQYFTDMAFQGDQSDSDLVEFCAFNFPLVVKTVGKDRWKLLERAYKCLVKDVQWKVRKSLSNSLHQIAKVVGTDIAETVLCSAFYVFLKDLNDVKIGVVSNIAQFLSVVSMQKRKDFLDIITSIPEETENWRIKNKIAEQLADLLKLYNDQNSYRLIVRLFLCLLIDEFAIIRNTTASISGEFIHHLISVNDEKNVDLFVDSVQKLVRKTWVERQLFVIICHHVINNVSPGFFDENFLPQLLGLVKDEVPNVKIILAKVINNDVLQNVNWKEDYRVLNVRNSLKHDSDEDVLYYTNKSKVTLRTAQQNLSISTTISRMISSKKTGSSDKFM